MRFFWYSVKGYSLSLAQRVQAEGNRVRWYQQDINPKTKGQVGKGLLDIVSRYAPDPEEIIVFDFSGAGKRADEARKRGQFVIGGGMFNDAIEQNRSYALKLMDMAGIKIPNTVSFDTIEEGARFAEAHNRPLVFKPEGTWPAWMTIVGDDNKSLAKDMRRLGKLEGNKIKHDLQEKVSGMEVSIEGWFNGEDWIYHSINSTFEEKRLLTGSLGPNTGCMGNAVFFYRHAKPRLAKETLFKLTSILRRVEYVGPLDINTKGGYALEFTPRFGYDAIQTMSELLEMEMGKVLSECAKRQAKQWKVSFDFAVGITTSVPPFPNDNEEELAKSYGSPIEVPHDLIHCYHLGDVQLNEEGDLITSGNDGVVGVMVAVAPTVTEARKVAYQHVEKLEVPNVQYRLDIGERAIKEIPQLLREVSDGNQNGLNSNNAERSLPRNLDGVAQQR